MGYNNKRRIASDLPADIDLKELAAKVRYIGSSYHKRNPGDFGLVPPSQPRPDKTLCDGAGIFKVSLAQRLLVIGIRRGLVSTTWHHGFPKHVCDRKSVEQGKSVEVSVRHGGR